MKNGFSFPNAYTNPVSSMEAREFTLCDNPSDNSVEQTEGV